MATGRPSHEIIPAGSLAKGIDVHLPDFQTDIAYSDDTVNATSGIFEGIGPRYGMAPIPGHSDNVSPASGKCPGLMRSETSLAMSSDANTWARTKVFAIYPIRIGGQGSNINTASTYYAVVVGYTTNLKSGTFIDVLLISSLVSTNYFKQSTNIYDGLQSPGADSLNFLNALGLTGELSTLATPANKATSVLNLTTLPSGANIISSTFFSVAGSDIAMQWLAGQSDATGDNTHPGVVALYSATLPDGAGGPGTGSSPMVAAGGVPSSFNYGNFPKTPRTVSLWAMNNFGGYNNIGWTITSPAVTTTNYAPLYVDYDPSNAQQNINFFSTSGTVAVFGSSSGTGSAYAANFLYLFNDPILTSNSAHQGVLIATGAGAFAVLIQDWYQNAHGMLQQYVDLSANPMAPPNYANNYTEDSSAVIPTCLLNWPSFTRGTAMSSSGQPALGAANSGVLRANTVYEFTYSVYNKRINYETNVGTPVKIQTGSNDFVSLTLFSNSGGVTDPTQNTIAARVNLNGLFGVLPWPGTTNAGTAQGVGNAFHMNHLEYRFYYRPEGSQSWLPALFLDAPKYWFYPNWTPLSACTGAIGGLPGGTPGGFQDYSPLPTDNYDCAVMYKNRAFWTSAKSLVFSLQNNIFAYPQRNTAACPTGSFRGMLVQAYYGQAEQDARLVVFGTDAIYVGKFTGVQQQVPVTVSSQAGPINFALDGTDFVLNAWTSVTAFSYRAAVVAEGVLYFWGPQGIFRDDGVNPITDSRISLPIEPTIFGLYDPSQTGNICCTYNNTTKEVVWFYPPATPDTNYPTYCLVWNTVKQTWLFTKTRGQVDGAQQLKVDTGIPTAGTRTVLFSRASTSSTVQRAQFFDQNNLASEFFPGQELMVSTISTPSTGVRRLTLASGSASLASVNVGDLIALQQCSDYANGALSTPSDFIAAVAAVNSGAGTVDITLPSGATLDSSATISNNYQFFPIWHAAGTNGAISGAGINAFPYVIDTKFWIPKGMNYWALWLYAHFVFKTYALLPGPSPVIALNYQTPISQGNVTDSLTLSNNSQNNCQIWHGMQQGSLNIEGQGISLTLSGFQLAGSWQWQFLQLLAQYKDGLQLSHFNG